MITSWTLIIIHETYTVKVMSYQEADIRVFYHIRWWKGHTPTDSQQRNVFDTDLEDLEAIWSSDSIVLVWITNKKKSS